MTAFVLWVGRQFVIVVFPDHTHTLSWSMIVEVSDHIYLNDSWQLHASCKGIVSKKKVQFPQV